MISKLSAFYPLWVVVLLSLTTKAALAETGLANPAEFAGLGGLCQRRYQTKEGWYGDIPAEDSATKEITCYPGALSDSSGEYYLTCAVAQNDTGLEPRSGMIDVEGICEKTSCAGTNDILSIDEDQEPKGASSERVTICHRTCSESNPWVRITIDKDAWEQGDEFCSGDIAPGTPREGLADGHLVSDCGVEDTWRWGSNDRDFLVKDHGSREDIANALDAGSIDGFDTQHEYWQYWERACPHVRQDPDHPNPCCGLNGNDDCCGGNHGTFEPTVTPTGIPTAYIEDLAREGRRLQTGSPTSACVADPVDYFAQDIYLTFMGTDGVDQTLSEALTAAGTSVNALEAEIVTQYNEIGGDGLCVYYSRKITSVSIDTSEQIPAINMDYDLAGFRVKATVAGVCTDCADHSFLPSDLCKNKEETYCADCVTLSGSSPGYVIQIAGKDLYPRVNDALSLSGTSAEIFRIQGDVENLSEPEPACSPTQEKYLEATGEATCLG